MIRRNHFTIHSDGGARGNPGPAACAFVLEQDGTIIEKKSKYLGIATNNYAEYQGVVLALNFLSNKNFERESEILFYLDSELVVKQLNGLYKIKNQDLKNCAVNIKQIIEKEGFNIVFKNIPRIKNKMADFLVNRELDIST